MAASAIGALVLGYGVQQNEQGQQTQRRALRFQQKTQEMAVSSQARAARLGREEIARSNARQPDVAALLAGAQTAAPVPTMLTGLGGVNPDRYKLGRVSLLGEVS